MPRLKLYYNGWVALPATFCQELRLATGSRLGAELVNETIVLRPMIRKAPVRSEGAPEPASATAPAPSKAASVVRRARRQTTGVLAVLPPTLKSRGRRKGSAGAWTPHA